ncbi:MAG: hypothetical protein HQL13_07415, partial [Candidatus Omnitrophica bacterium]|nr:hypothetical protein [Candidatus Omnitrophota bacterium]
MQIGLSIILLFSFWPDLAHAGGAIMRVQQMKARRQQPQMTKEQYLLYQQQMAAKNQQGAQNPQASPQQIYDTEVEAKNASIAQAIREGKNNPASTDDVP